MFKKTTSKILFLILLSTLLFSCTKKEDEKSENKTSAKSTESLEIPSKRAEERWNALIKQDWATAYLFETPSYRKNYTVEEYKSSFGTAITWKSIKFISNKKTGEKIMDVKVELTVSFSDGGETMLIPSMFDERWLLSEGQWWHTPK